jgi:sulfhydrogenase subunit delta
MAKKPRLGVFKFASCDGCQLTLLDCEDELLTVAGAVEIAEFLEATSTVKKGRLDVALVEGSITTTHDAHRIQHIRARTGVLVTIGACATAGGVQALRNFRDVEQFKRAVYARPEFIDTLATSTAIAHHVKVDVELRGCPIDKKQLLEVLTALLAGRPPKLPRHSVCMDCKRSGITCVMVAHGEPCLGPVTATGCGALCPTYGRGCFGCFGPTHQPQTVALRPALAHAGATDAQVERLYSTFNVAAPAFAVEHTRLRVLP